MKTTSMSAVGKDSGLARITAPTLPLGPLSLDISTTVGNKIETLWVVCDGFFGSPVMCSFQFW